MPDHLGAALEALEADEVVRSAMPGRLYDVFMHYKRDEWERYLAAVTDWERDAVPGGHAMTEVGSSPCAGSRGSSTATAAASARWGAT